jgi:hypothetical protein
MLKNASPQKQVKYDWQGLNSVMFTWANPDVIEQITIEPKLYKRENRWALVLEEVWPYPTEPLGDSGLLDSRVNWCIEKLDGWPGCTRMAYDQFWFKKKEEAEKFITLYTLTWR